MTQQQHNHSYDLSDGLVCDCFGKVIEVHVSADTFDDCCKCTLDALEFCWTNVLESLYFDGVGNPLSFADSVDLWQHIEVNV